MRYLLTLIIGLCNLFSVYADELRCVYMLLLDDEIGSSTWRYTLSLIHISEPTRQYT